ncbi:hypothetical protein JW964_23105 [candidate division KSB1 bacterium]|nr:hypothetical protein [candidate division KSB1 bacterium]
MKNEREVVQKILDSEEFRKHPAESSLLKYVAEATLQGEALDQTSIAIHALGKNTTFDPNEDSIVRVRIHNLRKMLKAYYLGEGIHDGIKLTISPGSYQVKFIHSKSLKQMLNFWYYPVSIIFIVILAVGNVYQWKHNPDIKSIKAVYEKNAESFIWNDFLKSDLPILFALGNNYFFHEIPYDTTQSYRTIRYSNINSIEDLNNFIRTQNQSDYLIERYDIALYENEIILSLHQILPLLYSYQKEIDIKATTDLTPQDLLKYNIIYIGNTKNLRALKPLLLNLNINFEVNNVKHRFFIKSGNEDSINVYSPIGEDNLGRRLDYVILDKLPGPNANYILLITSTDLTGVYEIIKLMSNSLKLPCIEKPIIEANKIVPKYFESLWVVSSLNRTDFKIKPIKSYIIPLDIELIRPED